MTSILTIGRIVKLLEGEGLAADRAHEIAKKIAVVLTSEERVAEVEAKAPTSPLNQAKAKAESLSMVDEAKVWNGQRVYITLKSHRGDWRGCANTKIYFQSDKGWVVEKATKGLAPTGFFDEVDAFAAAVGAVAR